MKYPTAALVWEIWRRGRRSAWLVLACISVCALVNLGLVDRLHLTADGQRQFKPFFGLLMTVSFFLLMGIFNFTESSPAREWNGFPYRLFVLPVTTLRLVALPMFLGVASVEILYWGWIKLVWTHTKIIMPEWFAVLFGAYTVFYLATLWCLAAFRITRIAVLTVGAISGICVACLPSDFQLTTSPWLSEGHLIAVTVAVALVVFLITWRVVARQRCGGGRHYDWLTPSWNWIVDALPRRKKAFASPLEAQFWFEWRRTGLVLPACVALATVLFVGPISWYNRADPGFTVNALWRIIALPIVLAFAIGKGFIKPEFWSTSLSIPPFIAVRPLTAEDFVRTKMKVAASSVAIAWLLVIGFIGLWLSLWADMTQLNLLLFEFRAFYAHSWRIIVALYCAGFVVLTWRCLVSGLWNGLSGSRKLYVGSICLQVTIPSLALLGFGIWSDSIDSEIKSRPDRVISIVVTTAGWLLSLAVILKVWFAVFAWRRVTVDRAWRYLILWVIGTLTFVVLAVLSPPPFDYFRLEHLCVLVALLVFPLARIGLAPASYARNRHQ